ncbi:MAG: DUF4212 domain-containing protein [Opitutales bacterium]|nr:DUF4212 domain-containing protein [Opitutales bacterium]
MKQPKSSIQQKNNSYWHASLKLLTTILAIWFLVSFGCGILFKDFLDIYSVGGAPLGFWMAQQGSILCFIGLLIAYSFWMNRLDEQHGYEEEE